MIICIGREFGSGGHEIGKSLAGQLGIPFYDKMLIDSAVERSGIEAAKLEKADERAANPWLHQVLFEAKDAAMRGMTANDILFYTQKQIILELADRSDCIFVGRCADAILEQAGIGRLSVFITALFEERVKRKMDITGMGMKETAELVRKTDKQRKAYYDYYTGRNWGKVYNYDLSVNSAVYGVEKTAGVLASLLAVLEK